MEDIVFDKTTWKTDPNAYARNYYHEKNHIFIPCVACKCNIKKLTVAKHNKTQKHKANVLKEENNALKEAKNKSIIDTLEELKQLLNRQNIGK